jgi:hypothetical protein
MRPVFLLTLVFGYSNALVNLPLTGTYVKGEYLLGLSGMVGTPGLRLHTLLYSIPLGQPLSMNLHFNYVQNYSDPVITNIGACNGGGFDPE